MSVRLLMDHHLTDRQIIEELALIAGASDAAEWVNRVDYLPLK